MAAARLQAEAAARREGECVDELQRKLEEQRRLFQEAEAGYSPNLLAIRQSVLAAFPDTNTDAHAV